LSSNTTWRAAGQKNCRGKKVRHQQQRVYVLPPVHKGVTASARFGRNHTPEAAAHIYGTAERIIKVDLQISHFVEA
jgi:hypothetical protein